MEKTTFFQWIRKAMQYVANFFKNNTDESSLRLYMEQITLPVSLILFAVFLFIIHRTFVPVKIINTGHVLEYVYSPIPWGELTLFVGGVIAAAITIWVGKKMNKEAEKP